MQTDVRFGSSFDKVEFQVQEALNSTGGIFDKGVVTCVTCAFWCANSSAGNGMSETGDFCYGDYYAQANIATGEFKLFKRTL